MRFGGMRDYRDFFEAMILNRETGHGIDPQRTGVPGCTPDKIEAFLAPVTHELESLRAEVLVLNARQGRRMAAAVALLQVSPIKERVPESTDLLAEARRVWPVFARASAALPIIEDLRGTEEAYKRT